MINTVIFDMDGLLINSEPFWRQSMKVNFATVGIHLTEELCMQTMGKKTIEVIQFWHEKQPWSNKDFKTLESDLVASVRHLIIEKGTMMPGVIYILDFFKAQGFKIGLASSSATILIETVLDKLQIKSYFEVAHSAEFETLGKPHPAVFLSAAKKLNSQPKECLVFEDSYNGILAAKAAGIRTIAIPDKEYFSQEQYDIADLKLSSLLEFNETYLTRLNY
jgi:HAD superfamily hydrolase (TIGR01509 family)